MSAVVAISAFGSPVYGKCARETILSVLEHTSFDVFVTCDQHTASQIPEHPRVVTYETFTHFTRQSDPYLAKFTSWQKCLEGGNHELIIHLDVDAVIVKPISEVDVEAALGDKEIAMIEQSVIIGTDHDREFFYEHFLNNAKLALTPDLRPPSLEEFRHYNSGVVVFRRAELERFLYWINDQYFIEHHREPFAGRMIADQEFLQVWCNVVHRNVCAELPPDWNHCWLWDEEFPHPNARILHFSNFTYGPPETLPLDLHEAWTGIYQRTLTETRISFIVVTYNSAAVLGDCLRLLQRFPNGEIIVVDNNSADDSADIAERLEVKVVRNAENLGFAQAANQGAGLASHETLCFLNPDALLTLHATRLAVEEISPGKMLVPNFVHGDGSTANGVQFGYTRLKLFRDVVSQVRLPIVGNIIEKRSHDRSWQWPIAACLFVTATDFEKLNGFNEDYFLYMEDVDFGYRASQSGISAQALPAVVSHLSSLGSSITPEEREKLLADARIQFARNMYGSLFAGLLRVSRALAIHMRRSVRRIR